MLLLLWSVVVSKMAAQPMNTANIAGNRMITFDKES